ncbi:hypothetical protein H0N96_01155 [Candidatus Micrarchaeota archaeon]|nr:hypothetical protein [Candidatus Micrarchaeota archaeon]
MNLKVVWTAFMVYAAAALVTFGVSGFINQAFGWRESLLSDAWKLVAIAAGGAIATGFVYPSVRGVKRGDLLITFVKRVAASQQFTDYVAVTALEDGKVGKKIRVQLPNGALAEGVITAYAGTLSPSAIRLVEAEINEPAISFK